MTLLLYWGPSGPRLTHVRRFESPELAHAYEDTLPQDKVAYVIEGEIDLTDSRLFKAETLVKIYNSITNNDPGVTTFESRLYGAEKVYKELVARFGEADLTSVDTAGVGEPAGDALFGVSRNEEHTSPTNGARAPSAGPGRRARFSRESIVTVIATENPHRASSGARVRFEFYVDGGTVGDFLTAGGTAPDLAYDHKHGYIAIDGHSNVTEKSSKISRRRSQLSQFSRDSVITLLTDKNPKRVGTIAHKRFGHYVDGIAVGAYLDAGGTPSDLTYDMLHGFIGIDGIMVRYVPIEMDSVDPHGAGMAENEAESDGGADAEIREDAAEHSTESREERAPVV